MAIVNKKIATLRASTIAGFIGQLERSYKDVKGLEVLVGNKEACITVSNKGFLLELKPKTEQDYLITLANIKGIQQRIKKLSKTKKAKK